MNTAVLAWFDTHHHAFFSRSWIISCYADRVPVVDLMWASKILVSLIERSAYDDAMSQQRHEHQGSVFMFSYFIIAVTVQFWQEKCFPCLEVTDTVNVYIPWVLLLSFELVAVSGIVSIPGMCSHSEGWDTSLGSDMLELLLNCCFRLFFFSG